MGSDTAFGSGNVFEDLGLSDPEERLAKADLASKITSVIESRGLSQVEAAGLAGITQPKISLITRGRLSDFSTEKLCRILNGLGVSVSLVLTEEIDWAPGSTTVHDGNDAGSEMEPEEETSRAMAM